MFDRFFQREYLFLHEGRTHSASAPQSVKESLLQANMVDSDDFKAKRRMSYGKLCGLVELLSKAAHLNKLNPT